MTVKKFKEDVLSFYREEGRDFPWRGNVSPWGVLVSEFMLQQTRTDRVVPYWLRWMELWPRPADLAKASLEEALREWSGLGYNRRCKNLVECALIITSEKCGKVPDRPESLLPLPGIGAYIAGAVACFAYNCPSVFIETNIRSAVLHFFFPGKTGVTDDEIFPILESALDHDNPRVWYYALMDYGAMLKKKGVNPGRRSAHYARQSPFEGSFRQARGKVLKTLIASGPIRAAEITDRCGLKEEDLCKALEALKKESMVAEKEGIYRIREHPQTEVLRNSP
jgi:A/G-specific adenine glycosylase